MQYVAVDGTDIAWRAYEGEGDRDVVLMFAGVMPIAALSEDRVVARLLEGLARLGRVIVFDRRGVGQSGPVGDWDVGRFELHRRDLEAVLDAAGVEHAVIVGHGNAAAPILAEAARRGPESMTLALCEPLNPWNHTPEAHERWNAGMAEVLEEGREIMELLAPERLATDPGFLPWWVRAGNLGAGPTTAARIVALPTAEEIERLKAVIAEVDVPTLVLRRMAAQLLEPDQIRAGDDHLRPTRYVELPGEDHNTFVGARIDDVIAEITEFVTGEACATHADRVLRAVLFTDLGGSTELLAEIGDQRWRTLIERHDESIDRAVRRSGGEVVKTTGDGVLATFGAASGALAAAVAIRDELAADGLAVRSAVHVGDVEDRGDDVAGIAVNIAARVLGLTEPGQVAATATAATASGGAGLAFVPRGGHELRGIDGTWDLFVLDA